MSCPAARLPNSSDSGGAHGIFALRSFNPVRRSLGSKADPHRADRAMPRVFPPGGPTCRLPDAFLGLFLSRDWPLKLLHPHSQKKRTIAGPQVRLLGYSSGQAVSMTTAVFMGLSCLGHFPLPGFQTSRDALARARSRTRHQFPATASGAFPLVGFSSMFASPSG